MATVNIYMDNGNVYFYDVPNEAKAREHMDAIIKTGYRSVGSEGDKKTITWFPPHRITKVVAVLDEPSTTKYPDKILST